MIFKLEGCKFLGQEERQSKKGNKYNVVSLMQGVDVIKLVSDFKLDFEFGQDLIAIIDYNLTYENMRLIGVGE